MEQVAYAIEEQVNDTYEYELEDQPNLTVAHADKEEASLVARLRRGDESAFTLLVERNHASLIRLAMCHVADRSIAEEVVQDTWMGLLEGLTRFEGRSSLKTWIFRILTNIAKTRAQRERRTLPFSALSDPEGVPEAAVDPDRFRTGDDPRWPGHWSTPPEPWAPEPRLLAAETREVIERAIEALPGAQRAVISLRDVQGWPAEEVCNALGITETNQRVLLHRARSKVRRALEDYMKQAQ